MRTVQAFQDIPRLYTAIAEWLACMTFVVLVNGHKDLKKFGPKSIASLLFPVVQGLFLVITEPWHNVLWAVFMAIAILNMFFFLLFHFEGRILESTGCIAGAFLLAEFAASLEWQIYSYIERLGFGNAYTNVACLIIVYASVLWGGYYMEKKILTKEYLIHMNFRETLTAVGITAIVFVFSNLSFLMANGPFSGEGYKDIFIIRTLVDAMGLAVLFGVISQFREFHIKQDIAEIQTLYHSQYERYRSYQDSLEVFHMKYHDLKHQLAGIRGENNPKKREEWIDRMENELDYFQIVDPTGNQVLDALLDSNCIRIIKNNIKLTCVVDGALLEFIHVMDLCTIFGNALDNAIESVIQLADEKKRMIHLTVSAKKNFLYIEVENYCENQVIPDEEKFFQTTKADKQNHGYGLRSIRYSVEKYGGTVTAELKNNWFELHILMPMPLN